MEVKSFREQIYTGSKYPRHKGQDARPYIDEHVIMVADGLGGKGASVTFNQDLNDADKLLDVLFEGVYEDYSNEEFEKYVSESFADFCAIPKEEYYAKQNVPLMLKGGYFASRIVTAILVHEFLYNKKLWKKGNSIWDRLHAVKSEEELKAFEKETGEYFAKLIDEKLQEIVTKAEFVKVGKMSNMLLLPTTLTTTLYNECEDYVEALYLQAGDTLPYVLDEKGLAQIMEAHEDESNEMTNRISANEGFYIECKYHRFKKPCLLLNASDGCFDLPLIKYTTPLTLEKLVLDCIVDNKTLGKDLMEMGDTEGMTEEEKQNKRIGEQIRCYFEFGKGDDDSASMAIKSFGFESFEEVQAFAKKRLEKIQEEYLEEMPDLCDHSYQVEKNKITNQEKELLESMKFSLWQDESVREYCKGIVAKGGVMADYDNFYQEVKADIQKALEGIEANEKEALPIITRYYLAILEAEKKKDFAAYKKLFKKAKKYLETAENELKAIQSEASSYQMDFDKQKEIIIETLKAAQASVKFDGVLSGNLGEIPGEAGDKKIDLALVEPAFELQEKIKKLLADFASGKGAHSKEIKKSLKAYFALNVSVAEKDNKKDYEASQKAQEKGEKYVYEIGPVRLAENLVSISEIIKEAVFLEEDRSALLRLAEEIKALKENLITINEGLQEKLGKLAYKYWMLHSAEIIMKIYEGGEDCKVGEKAKKEIDEVFNAGSKSKRMAVVEVALAQQTELAEKYEETSYSRVFNASVQLPEYEEVAEEPVEEAEESIEEAEESVEEAEEAPAKETEEESAEEQEDKE